MAEIFVLLSFRAVSYQPSAQHSCHLKTLLPALLCHPEPQARDLGVLLAES
jgi:hypothetical protein